MESLTRKSYLAANGRTGIVLLAIVLAVVMSIAQGPPRLNVPPQFLAGLNLLVKMVGVALAFAISLLTWNTRRAQPINFVFAGFAFFAATVLGATQLAILQGMPGVTVGHDPRLLMALRLGSGVAVVVALWAAALGPPHPGTSRMLHWGMSLTGAGILTCLSLAAGTSLWLDGNDLAWTGQAVAGMELALALVLMVASALLFRRYRRGQRAYALLAMAGLLGAIGMAFSSRLPLDDMSKGVLDDAYKALASLLVYRAMFREGVLAPWHDLIESGRAVEEDWRRYHQLFESAPDGLLLVDAAGNIMQANPAAAAMFGWSITEMTGQAVETLIPAPARDAHVQARSNFQINPQSREMGRGGSLMAMRRDGTTFPVEIALVPQEFGGRRTTLCIARDVTQKRQLEQSLMRQALHDALTDLPNRRHFRDSVTKALAHAERHGGTLALMFIDLDNFKQVNDTLGHGHGDELLRQVSYRLTESLRAGDLLARMGGDEFAVLLTDASVEDAEVVAAKVLRELAPPFHHTGQIMKVGASIGITLFPADGRFVDDLLANADAAMYRSKGSGRNTWCFFEQQMTDGTRERSSLQQDLVHAVDRGQFELMFQPRVRADDGVLTGFEALLRWRHPQRGQVPPDVFIALAEESGQIVPIGNWVLRESCAQATRWLSIGGEGLTMAVNVSTHQLRHPNFVAEIEQVLKDTGWPAPQLELEITETALMEDPIEAAALLHRIAALGVRLAVDDFGTGYSSLAYLKDFPLHRLKVDRCFVSGLQVNHNDRVLATSIIQLAHALGLQVTAEGVETSQQRDFLIQRHCDELQGFLFSTPISATVCEALLASRGHVLRLPDKA